MSVTILSIGLNVGQSEPPRQLSETLRCLAPCAVHGLAMGRAEWQGIPERFIHAAVEFRDADTARLFASHLARVLNQDCIAILGPKATAWKLVSRDANVTQGESVDVYPPIVSRGEA